MVLIALLFTAIVLFGVYCSLRSSMTQIGPFLPDWYILSVFIYTAGACFLAFFTTTMFAEDVATMASVTLVSSLMGAIAFLLLHKHRYKNVRFTDLLFRQNSGKIEMFGIYFGVVFSSLIAVLFIYFVLTNDTIGALLSFASITGDSTLLDARKAITSGSEGYFAPGYVKQFRDILIPILIVSIMFLHIKAPMKFKTKITLITTYAVVFVAMLISGQRLIIIFFLVTVMFGRHYYLKSRAEISLIKKENKNGYLKYIVLIIVFYATFTVLLGRVDGDMSTGEIFVDVVKNFFARVFLALPEENMITYPYWSIMGPTMGESWIDELGTILPGIEGISFSNKLHSIVGGSDAGNSPLGLPADVWLAWGWVGVFVVPFIYAILYGLLDMALMSEHTPIFGAIKIYMAIACLIILSPYGFILYGGAISIISIAWVKILKFYRLKNLKRHDLAL